MNFVILDVRTPAEYNTGYIEGSVNIDYYMNLPYNIIIRKAAYEGYFAKVEELEGCMTQGETYEETFKNIQRHP